MFSYRSIAAGLVIAGTCAFHPAVAQAPIKIGVMGELSGLQAAYGQDQYDAFMMYVEKKGGKLGGVPVQILKEDDQFKPELGVQIVQKLIEKENVPIIVVTSFSNVMMAVHNPITSKEVFLISSLAGPSQMAGKLCSPYQFITAWQLDSLAEATGKYAMDKGYKRVYLMAPNYQAGKDLLTGFKRAFTGQIIDEVYTPLNQLDFSVELAQVAAAKPDAVYVFYPGGLGISFVRQYQQAGLLKTVPLIANGSVDGSTLPALKDTALGVTFGSIWGPDLDNPVNRLFVEEFEKKYNRIATFYGATSYDAAQLLDSAIAKVKGNVADKKAFMAALKAADFRSVRGNFKFNNNNYPIHDIHIQEVARDAKGRISLRTAATPLRNYPDTYHKECPMK